MPESGSYDVRQGGEGDGAFWQLQTRHDLNLVKHSDTAMSMFPSTGPDLPAATDEVAAIVDFNTATFPAETRSRLHETGMFTGVASRSVQEIVDVTVDQQTTVRWHLINFVVLIHAWLDHFHALEPAWQSAGDSTDFAASRASIRTFKSFKGDSSIQVMFSWHKSIGLNQVLVESHATTGCVPCLHPCPRVAQCVRWACRSK